MVIGQDVSVSADNYAGPVALFPRLLRQLIEKVSEIVSEELSQLAGQLCAGLAVSGAIGCDAADRIDTDDGGCDLPRDVAESF